MSKIVVMIIIILSLLPIGAYLILNRDTETKQQEQTPTTEGFTLPTPNPNDPQEGQCAICMRITDAEPKAQCLQNFGCS